MTVRKATEISLLAFFLFAVEFFVYFAFKMHPALHAGTLASVVAYSHLWLMALTLSLALGLPLGNRIAVKMGQEDLTRAFSTGVIGLALVGFTTFSFVKASSVKTQVAGMGSAQKTEKGQADLSQYIEFRDSEIKVVDPETLQMILKFTNKSNEDITELDYVLVAVEDVQIFYKIKIREAVYFPSKQEGSTTLTWQRSKLKSPELFDRLLKAHKEKRLRIFAKPARITLVSGEVKGE